MPYTDTVVMSWGGLALSTKRIDSVRVEIDNAVDAITQQGSDYTSQRASYAETLHDLTHVQVMIFECYSGVTSESAFTTRQAARAGSPVRVLYWTATDKINGGSNIYYWADTPLSDLIQNLYWHKIFAGHIDSWSYTLNRLTLELTGTQRAEARALPENVVGINSWPNAGQSEGKSYPEVYGSPGAALDSDKINDGIGSVPAVLVNRSTLQYVVAGHALTSVAGETNEANTVALWCAIPGYTGGYGYLEGCSFDLSATDTDGNTIATVTLPAVTIPIVYLPTLAEGSYFANTATSPENATGRTANLATLSPGDILQLAVSSGLEQAGNNVLRVWIATSTTNADLRVRWTGPQSQTVAGGTTSGPRVDSVSGWDASGKVEISGTVYDYTGITEISASVWQLDVSGYGGPTTGSLAATMVGAWQTVTSVDMEVTDQRDWTKGDFYKFELELENTSGSIGRDIQFLGFRVEVELSGYPEVYVPCEGTNVTFRSTDYGASQNPVLQVEDVHTRLLALNETNRIGATFDTALSLLAAWSFDFALVRQTGSAEFLDEIARQSKLFLWRDAGSSGVGDTSTDSRVQVGVYRLNTPSDLSITQAADIIDTDGDGFEVAYIPPEDVYNRVYLHWGHDYATGAFTEQYWITEADSYPVDTTRQAAAAVSQAEYGLTNTLTIEAPYIQDESTALLFLQFLFDFHRVRRKRIQVRVPAQLNVSAGSIVAITHDLLDQPESFIVESVSRQGDVITLECLSVSLEGAYEAGIGYDLSADVDVWSAWGSAEFFETWGGAITSSESFSGAMTDYGLELLARRFFTDTSEKPSHAQIGQGQYSGSPSLTDLKSAYGSREAITVSQVSTTITIEQPFYNDVSSSYSVAEAGLFTGATGDSLLGRVYGTSAAVAGRAEGVRVTFTLVVRQPSAGSSVTDHGLVLMAQRFDTDTSDKPAYIAIGTDGTGEDLTDVALGAQVSSRQAMNTGYPLQDGLGVDFASSFDSATYGGNTIREIGLFTGSTGNNAIVRKVPTDPIVLGASDDATMRIRLTAENYS